jgi:hypothetical protein
MEVEHGNKRLSVVRFDGDELQVVGESREDAWVVLRPACEALGLDDEGQRQRLLRSAWATACMTQAVAQDGKNRELFCIHLDTVPMWLATIETGRVRPEAREKLIRYQREAARVLADHFLGRRPSLALPSPQAFAAAVIPPLVESVTALFREQQERRADQSFIPPWAARLIRHTITQHAKAITRNSPDPKAYRRQRGADELSLRIQFNFCGTGKRWEMLPVSEWPRMSNRLEELQREAGRIRCGTQLALTLAGAPAAPAATDALATNAQAQVSPLPTPPLLS